MNWFPEWLGGKKTTWSFRTIIRGPQQADLPMDISMEVYEGSKPYVSGVLAGLKAYFPEKQNGWLYRPAERRIQVTRDGRTTDVNLGFELQTGDIVSITSK
jgi:hypothetical protein